MSEIKPYCKGYVALEKWGRCSRRKSRCTTEFEYKKEEKEHMSSIKINNVKHTNDVVLADLVPIIDVLCGTEDCPVEGRNMRRYRG
jgi:hypothetical protein